MPRPPPPPPPPPRPLTEVNCETKLPPAHRKAGEGAYAGERSKETQGISTVSITWITPLDASTSARDTSRLPTMTLPSADLHRQASLPLTVFAAGRPSGRSWSPYAAHDMVGRIGASFSLFSGLSSVSTVPAGSLANASSVGANTVNGPALERVHQAGGLKAPRRAC